MKKNKTIFLLVLFSIVMLAFTQAFARDYRSKGSGDWSSKNTWQAHYIWGWGDADSAPDNGDGVITIRNGHTVTVTANVIIDQATIDAGGTAVVNNGINLTLNNGSGTDLTVNGTLSLQGTSALALNSSASLAYGAAGTLVYTGSNAKTTGSELLATVPNLTIDNSADVTLNSSTTINGALTFTSGKLITTADYDLTLGTTATISEKDGKYLVGKVKMLARTVGSGGSSFGGIGVRLASGIDVGNVTIERVSGSAGMITVGTNHGIDRKWKITTIVGPATPINLTLRWQADDNHDIDTSQAAVYKSDDDEATWAQVGSEQDVRYKDSITVPVSSFSIFTVGDIVNGGLPVELTSFSAAVNNDVVVLSWVTKTEKNNYGFDVERTSPLPSPCQGEGVPTGRDGRGWEKIGFVQGSGNSNSPKNYSFTDKAVNGSYSYRLKQVNTDGTYVYSDPINVEVNAKPMKYDLANYPNPFNPETKIQFELPQVSHVNLTIYNIVGEKVVTLVDETMEAGVYQKTFSSNSYYGQLSSGIYFYRLTTDNGINITKKMVLAK